MTTISCPECGTGVIVSDGQVGTEVACATCGQPILVTPPPPENQPAALQPAAPAAMHQRPKVPIPHTNGEFAITACVVGSTIGLASSAFIGATVAVITLCLVVTIIGIQVVRRLELLARQLEDVRHDTGRISSE